MALMVAGEFVTGRTNAALAEKWNVGIDCAEKTCAEASRRLRAQFSPDLTAVYILAHTQQIVAEARADKDHSSRLGALKLLADVSGAKAPVKIDLRAVPIEELRREYAELTAELAPLLAEGDDE